ncbi:MAG: alpha-amylase family protein, partial [Victivallaceae bacterium]
MDYSPTGNSFTYGAQYYRAPTPLPQEWEQDFSNLKKLGLNTVQIRVQWRKNERLEGEYDFSDIDRLFALAEQYDIKVIIKFLLENAPDYIYRKYDGYRRNTKGEIIPPTANGAFYIGGWLPCFDNPEVMKKSKDFVRKCVERYKNRSSLLLWNIWNEPRSRPIEQCGCRHSVKLYRVWLRERYSNIERLNDETGKGWESFDSIFPPVAENCDYLELYLWRQWASDAIADQVKNIYDEVKNADSEHKIICHVGICSIIQDACADASDDEKNAAAVDFYGTSLPTAHHFKDIIAESRPFMICDWIRSVSPYFWVNELYSDWGNWDYTVSTEDFRFKTMATIACGAKGLMYWQYRAERLGNENNLSGLVNIDGSSKNVSVEAARIAEFIRRNEKFLLRATPPSSGIGILYSRPSDIINRIENTNGGNFAVRQFPYLYKKAIAGIYAAFRELGIAPVMTDSGNLGETLPKLHLLYLPEAFIVSPEQFAALKEFAAGGGKIIAEEGFALRDGRNTWLYPRWPGLDADEF